VELDEPRDLVRLLTEVDAALSRLDAGNLGLCDFCHEAVDEPDLLANPMATYCLCRMSPEQQTALERDLDLAWRVQAALLPPEDLAVSGWQTHYRYLPHGAVSGDYCDLIVAPGDGGLYFMLGDVSGKGVAASLLMAHLNASLRSLAQSGLSPQDMLGRANRILADSTLSSHYVTLVCGRAMPRGEIEIVNAGHCAPFVVRSGGFGEVLHTGGLPLGLAVGASPGGHYPVERVTLREGDSLALYTDGVTEARNAEDEAYGVERLLDVLRRCRRNGPREQIAECLSDLQSFSAGEPHGDDLTMLVLKRH
jgi:sigma-B regulation protein RsbU (phosphoserine phosphatase)